jgi:hypothetical protein
MLTRDKLEYQKRLRFIREAKEKAKTASEELKLAKIKQEDSLTKPMTTLGDKENKVPARGETPKEYNEVPETRETSRVKKPVEAGDKGDNALDIDLSDLDYAKISEGTQRQEDAEQALERHKKSQKEKRDVTDIRSHAQKTQKENVNLSLADVLRECGCEMKAPFDAPEEEHQGYMLVQSLDKLADQAAELSDMANHEDNPEPWVEFKVNAAAEQLDAVHDYIKYGREHRPDMEHHEGSEHVEELYEETMQLKEEDFRKLVREAVKAKLQELSSFNKEELPGSGDMPALMEEFDDLLLEFSKKALDLHAKMVEEMKVDMLGGVAAPQMSPRIGERNRMLTVRAGLLRKLAANCTAAIEAVRREG